MSAYTELNIEKGMPLVNDAMNNLKISLDFYRKNGYKCILIIHGYGSSGKGGSICNRARKWLNSQKQNKKVKSVIFGEEVSIFNDEARKLKSKYRELTNLLTVCNHGVTVVEF